MVVTEFSLPWPPSVNSMWRTPNKGPLAGRTMLSKEGRDYRRAVAAAVQQQRVQPVGDARLRVDLEVRMPDKRRRDLDNMPKALFDGLTHAGVWTDDSQIDDLRIHRSWAAGGCVIVRIEALPEPQDALPLVVAKKPASAPVAADIFRA